MNRVLLTGATGFIGRHTIPLLIESDYEVHAVSSGIAQESCYDIFWHHVDLLDVGQVAKLIAEVQPTHLLHFAWHTEPGKYWDSLVNFQWVQASLGLLQEFCSGGGQRVVMAGTCAEYDWRYGYCSERITPLFPTTVYGTCKYALYMLLESFSARSGLSSAWGRIFFLYGPHEHPSRLVPSVICSLSKREVACCSHGEQIRDFLHVRDVASAFVALLESNVTGPVNIASGQPITLKDIIYKIADRLSQPELVELGILSAPNNEPPLLVADVRRLTEEVRWRPSCDLEHGLDQTIAWWKDRVSEGSK